MFKVFYLLLALAYSAKPFSKSNHLQFSDFCSAPDSILTLTEFQIPDVVKKSEPFQLNMSGTLKEAITQGTLAKVKVKYGVLTVVDHTFDACEWIATQGVSCPFEAGPLNIKNSIDIPSLSPSGHYQGHIEIISADQKPVTCIDFKFKMEK